MNSRSKMPSSEQRDYYVTVCKSCKTAVCWHGEMYCMASQGADIEQFKASELDKLNLEHPSYYTVERLTAIEGGIKYV